MHVTKYAEFLGAETAASRNMVTLAVETVLRRRWRWQMNLRLNERVKIQIRSLTVEKPTLISPISEQSQDFQLETFFVRAFGVSLLIRYLLCVHPYRNCA